MTDLDERLSDARSNLDAIDDLLARHRRVLDGIADHPDTYDLDKVDDYLDAVDNALADTDFLAPATAKIETLEKATDAAEQAVLADATVRIDDHEIDGVEVQSIDAKDAMEASILVESPKVNQLRGGRPTLGLPDGRTFVFSIEKTLIADVSDDKSGYLELILGLKPV